MNSKYILAFLLLIALVVSGCTSQTTNDDASDDVIVSGVTDETPDVTDPDPDELTDEIPIIGNDDTEQVVGDLEVSRVHVVRTDEGYLLKETTIKVGSMVIWTNNSSADDWPASAMHPTHTNYPGSGITKCGSDDTIFDACKGLGFAESYAFTFNEVGEWTYHDHLHPSNWGKIIVVE